MSSVRDTDHEVEAAEEKQKQKKGAKEKKVSVTIGKQKTASKAEANCKQNNFQHFAAVSVLDIFEFGF